MHNAASLSRKLQTHERPRYESYLLVTSPYGFPIDMLRYDRCMPAQERDAHVMQTGTPRNVVVVRLHDGRDPKWTYARWRSFGCTVEPVSAEYLYDRAR